MKKRFLLIASITLLTGAFWWRQQNRASLFRSLPITVVARRVPIDNGVAVKIVRGAKAQYGTLYDASS